MMVTWPAAAKAADGNPTNASNSQQAPPANRQQTPRRRICSPARSYRPPLLITPLGLRFCRPAVTFASEAKIFGRAAHEHPHMPPCALIPRADMHNRLPGPRPMQNLQAPFARRFPIRTPPEPPSSSSPRVAGSGMAMEVWQTPGRLPYFPLFSGRHVSEQTACAAFSGIESAEPDLCHGASRHDSLFPSRKAILTFSNVRVARRNQLH